MDIQTLLWGLGAVALIGLGLGFFFRLPVLVVTSAIVATIVCVTSVRAGSSTVSAILLVFGHLLVLQGSYLAGLVISAWALEVGKRYRVRRLDRSIALTDSVADAAPGFLRQRTSTAQHQSRRADNK